MLFSLVFSFLVLLKKKFPKKEEYYLIKRGLPELKSNTPVNAVK
jgi:hypothetical protein